jgi:hypothetical protein
MVVREGEPVSLFPSIIGAIVLLALYRMVAVPRLSVPTAGQDYLDHIRMRSGVFDVHGFSGRFYSPPGKISAMHFKHTSFTEGPTSKRLETPIKGESNSNNRKMKDLVPIRENGTEEFTTTNQGLRSRGHGDRFRLVSDLTRVGSDPVTT